MKKAAVFGNTGGGKSTLAKRLAGLMRLPLYQLDLIQYRVGGGKVPDQEYLKARADLLRQDEWIIDGYGSVASAWEGFAVADTLVYIDLPLFTHYWWVTKRLILSRVGRRQSRVAGWQCCRLLPVIEQFEHRQKKRVDDGHRVGFYAVSS